MVRTRRSISVVMVVTFLIFMGIAATGFCAQQTPAAQQRPAVQQQTAPLKAAPAPIRVTATLGVSPASYTGNCPALISFRGHITVNQPTTVQYKFIRSDNAQAPVQTLNFPRAGTQEVIDTWQLGGPGLSTSGWEAIQVISPVSVQSNRAEFRIRCAGQGQPGQQGGPGQQTGPQGQQGVPVRITAQLGVKPASYTGNCPALISFRGHITVNRPTTVQYKFIRSDNASAPVQTLNFPRAGTQEVTTTWQLGGPGLSTSGWEAIQVISPVSVESNKAEFRIRCAGEGQTGQQGAAGQQPGQQGQQGIPIDVKARLSAKPASYTGNCPALITFGGYIAVNQPMTVQYKFIRSDNAEAPVQTLYFSSKSRQEVTTTWQLGGPGLTTSGWEAIQVISPVSVQSNRADFRIRCAGDQGQPGQQGVPGQQGQLSDLTIEDITLNEQCFVVVKVKNNGPGVVPDKVWTDHSPDSSAVYLHINGKTWGGETIWGFDPAKNLQNPGGTAIMTSNLKVTGTATIEATVDSTGKVRETNEANNEMRKQLTCQARVSVQPGVVARPDVVAQPGVVTPTGVGREDCISFNPATTTVQQIKGSWKVVDGSHWMFDFGNNESDARKALAIIQRYRMNQLCFVGRPNPPFQYMLVSGNSPVGALGGEDCVSFNPATTTVQQIQGSWKVVDGSHWMFEFGANKAEADQTLAIIKKYGFTHSCYVGRPGPKFTYLRK